MMVVLGQRGCIVTARTFPDLGNLKCKSPGSGSLCHPSKTIAWETLPGPSSVGYLDKRGTLGSLLKIFEVQGFRAANSHGSRIQARSSVRKNILFYVSCARVFDL